MMACGTTFLCQADEDEGAVPDAGIMANNPSGSVHSATGVQPPARRSVQALGMSYL